MTETQRPSRRSTASRLRVILLDATMERRHRESFIDGPRGPEFAWQAYEREQMHAAVNAERAALGKPPVPVDGVLDAAHEAGGHCDYAFEYAWHCSRLVFQEELDG